MWLSRCAFRYSARNLLLKISTTALLARWHHVDTILNIIFLRRKLSPTRLHDVFLLLKFQCENMMETKMTIPFDGRSAAITGPAPDGFAITPDDATELSEITRAIYIGTAGDITLTLVSNTELLFKNIPSGTILPVRARRIKATGTTATDLLGLV